MKWTDVSARYFLVCRKYSRKKAVDPGDLSDEDIFFSDYSLAKINARSEILFMAVGRSLILRVALSLGS